MEPLLSWIGDNKFAVYPASDFPKKRKRNSPHEDGTKDQICLSSDTPKNTLNVFSVLEDGNHVMKSTSVDITPIQLKKSQYPNFAGSINPEVIGKDSNYPHPRCMESIGGNFIALGIGPAVHIFNLERKVDQDYVKKKISLLGGKKDVPVRIRTDKDDILHYREVQRHSSHEGLVLDLSYKPERTLLASGSKDLGVRIWDVSTGRRMRDYKGHSSQVNGVEWNPKYHNLLLSGSNNEVLMRDYRLSTPISTWVIDSGARRVVWNPMDERQFMINCGNGHACIYDIRVAGNGGPLNTIDVNISVVSYHPTKEDVFVTGSTTGMVKMWEPNPTKTTLLENVKDKICCLSFSPNGKTLAYGSSNNSFGIIRSHPNTSFD